jgi:hypothetical protein
MSASTTTRAVIATLKAAASFQERVADVRATLDKATLTDKAALADALRPGVAQFYGIELTIKSTGRTVIPADHVHAESARTALSKLTRAVMGETANHKAPAPTVRIKATERSAYDALLAACGGDVARLAAVVKALKV